MGEKEGVYRVLVAKPDGKRPTGTPRNRWEDNLRFIFRIWMVGMDWIDVAQDTDMWQAVVNALINLQVP